MNREIICVGGFLVKKGRILFGKRAASKTWAANTWDIPGGKARKQEHPLYALRRELEEETGIEVLDAKLIETMQIKDGDGFFTYHIYHITHFRGKPRNCSDEHSKLRWLSPDDLKKKELALPEYARLIEREQLFSVNNQ